MTQLTPPSTDGRRSMLDLIVMLTYAIWGVLCLLIASGKVLK